MNGCLWFNTEPSEEHCRYCSAYCDNRILLQEIEIMSDTKSDLLTTNLIQKRNENTNCKESVEGPARRKKDSAPQESKIVEHRILCEQQG